MRRLVLTGAFMAGAMALPALADGYATTSTYSHHGSAGYVTAPAASSCCCCAKRVHATTYVTAPVVTNRYTRTYTRLAPPDCYHTDHTGHAHTQYTTSSVQSSQSYYAQSSYAQSSYGQSGYATGGEAYGEGYYDDAYYGDEYYDDGYYEAAPAYGYVHADREDPWAHYDGGWKR